MSNTYGENLKLSIFGQSHGPAVGMTLDGIPAGLPMDPDRLQAFLNRRAPGRSEYTTPRREKDIPEFLSGVSDGYTCGAPIAAIIPNCDARTEDYEGQKECPRPGHADYTAQIKYGGFQDAAGGGHFSGRLTAPLCIAGGLCIQWLAEMGIRVGAHIRQIHDIADIPFDPMHPQLDAVRTDFPVLTAACAAEMRNEILKVKAVGDSVGGILECAVVGLPAGLGEPMFGGMESRIAQIVYGIPAVKGVEFGDGASAARHLGSQMNDCYTVENGVVRTLTNHCGGILGGITDGMPLIFRAAIKPTPSIAIPQQSVCLANGRITMVEAAGRHDPCIVPRAVPVVEAAAAIAVFDAILGNTQTGKRKRR